MRTKFINAQTGSVMWVADNRVDEYLAAGHKLAAKPIAEKPEEEPIAEKTEEELIAERPEEAPKAKKKGKK